MLTFQTNGKAGLLQLTLPTSISEITKDYLLDVTKDISIANNYSLIAICHREKLSSFIMTGKNKANSITTKIVPLYVKSGNIDGDNEFIESLNSGEKLILSGTSISLGLHVVANNNNLTIDKFLKCLDGDATAYNRSLSNEYSNQYVYFVEFKLIPNVDIIGVYRNINTNITKHFPIKEVNLK